MADLAAKEICSSNFLIKSTEEFESSLKNRLKWRKEQWGVAGESRSRFNKLCNSLNYWKKKLGPAAVDVSIVITIFNFDKDVRVELSQIVEAIESIDSKVQVQGVSNFRNPRYMAFYFKNKEDADIIKEKFRMIDDSFIVYLSWALEENNVTVLKVHWLPMVIDVDLIKKTLDKYVNCIEEERQFISLMSGRNLPSGSVSFRVVLNKGVKADDIPHLMNIANMETLVTVSGRSPLCLSCETLGHISRECNMRFCDICKSLKPKAHECISITGRRSYAATLKSTEIGADIELEDWGAEIVVENNEIKSSVLSEKITGLQSQIQKLNTEITSQNLVTTIKALKSEVIAGPVICVSAGFITEDALSRKRDDMEVSEEGESLGSDNISLESENISKEEVKMTAAVKKKKRKKDEKKITGNIPKSSKSVVIKTQDYKPLKDESMMYTYGKPNYNNARRKREAEKFNKISEEREFVFKD